MGASLLPVNSGTAPAWLQQVESWATGTPPSPAAGQGRSGKAMAVNKKDHAKRRGQGSRERGQYHQGCHLALGTSPKSSRGTLLVWHTFVQLRVNPLPAIIHAARMSGGCEVASSPSQWLARSPPPPWCGHSPAAAALTCKVTVLVSTGTQRSPSSPQQPPQRCRATQEGLKMYSTSLGNSVTTSTSCSRGRQKLRFQISRKVRTERDRGGGL